MRWGGRYRVRLWWMPWRRCPAHVASTLAAAAAGAHALTLRDIIPTHFKSTNHRAPLLCISFLIQLILVAKGERL